MKSNLEIIGEIKTGSFTDSDGENFTFSLQPGMNEAELKGFAKRMPEQYLDPELAEILSITRGWEGQLDPVSFDALGEFGYEELSPFSICLWNDGFGNYWILDIEKDGKLGKVFFACHDPAVFVIHSQNINQFLNHLLELYQNSSQSYLNEVHDNVVNELWDKNPFCYSKGAFLSQNPQFESYLEPFRGDDWSVADLRSGKNKIGFAWGKYDSRTTVIRHPNELIWVMKNRPKGFLARLFGGK